MEESQDLKPLWRALRLLLAVIITAVIAVMLTLRLTSDDTRETTLERTINGMTSQLTKTNAELTNLNAAYGSTENDLRNALRDTAQLINTDGWQVGDTTSLVLPDGLIADLPAAWESATVTKAMYYLVSHVGSENDLPTPEQTDETTMLFPVFAEDHSTEPLVTYTYAVWSLTPIELTINGTTTTIPGGELVPVTSFAWSEALAGCTAELRPYDGAVDISCGSGDNGCNQLERSRVNIAGRSVVEHSVCANGCDIGENEPWQFICGDGPITLPW